MSPITRLLRMVRRLWRRLRHRMAVRTGLSRADPEAVYGTADAVQRARQQGRAAWMAIVRHRAPHLLDGDEAHGGPVRREVRWPKKSAEEVSRAGSVRNQPRYHPSGQPPQGDAERRPQPQYPLPASDGSLASSAEQYPHPERATPTGGLSDSPDAQPPAQPLADRSAAVPTPAGDSPEYGAPPSSADPGAAASTPTAVAGRRDEEGEPRHGASIRCDMGSPGSGSAHPGAEAVHGAGAPNSPQRWADAWQESGRPEAPSWVRDDRHLTAGHSTAESADAPPPAQAPPTTEYAETGADVTPPSPTKGSAWPSAAPAPESKPSDPWLAVMPPASAEVGQWPDSPTVPPGSVEGRWPTLLADPAPASAQAPRAVWAEGDRQQRLQVEQRGR